MNTRGKLLNLARRNILVVSMMTTMQGIDPRDHIVQKRVTRICIEGYPRSSNSFSVRMFRIANGDTHVGHHTHSTANIARALHYGIPVIVLIRNPVDAITSSVIAKNLGNIDNEVWYYLSFYHWVEPRRDAVVIADFDTVTRDFNCVIRQVNEKYGTAFNYVQDLAAAAEQVRQAMHDRLAHLEERDGRLRMILGRILPEAVLSLENQKDASLRWLATPNEQRKKAKADWMPLVTGHPHISEAQAVYARLIGQR